MTLSRFILAVLLLAIAGMIWRVDRHVQAVATVVARPAPAIAAAPPERPAPPARIGAPRVRSIRHIARHPPTVIDTICRR